MDKRTRVLNAMNKREVDHVPVGLWFHFYGEEAAGKACVEAHLKYYRETDLDFLKVMSDGYAVYPLPEIRKTEDWRKLEPMDSEHPFIREQVERAKDIVAQIGDVVADLSGYIRLPVTESRLSLILHRRRCRAARPCHISPAA